MVDLLISICRFPVGVLAVPFCVVFWFCVWPLEVIYGIASFPFRAVISGRSELKAYYQTWPFGSLARAKSTVGNIWSWIVDP